jgi:competence protein ComEA
MELQEKLLPFIKEHGIALFLGVVGLFCLGYGLITLSQPQTPEFSNLQPSQDTISSVRAPVTTIPKQITIDIEGSVQKPGVYTLPATSRTQDALIAAGGLSENADRQQVAQRLNLAAPLTDGAKLYIPVAGEQMVAAGTGSDSSTGTVKGASSKTININQSNEADLDALPGVGPVTAQKIIDNRPYQSVQDLLDKKIVGQSVFTKIKDQVTVY